MTSHAVCYNVIRRVGACRLQRASAAVRNPYVKRHVWVNGANKENI